MTLFFNLSTLELHTNNDPEYMLAALEKFYRGITIPKSAKEKYKPIKELQAGSSFLLNPKALFKDQITDPIFRAQYIRLAGRRNYLHYKTLGIKTLDLTLYVDINLSTIKHNPLITAQNNKLLFKYEEENGS